MRKRRWVRTRCGHLFPSRLGSREYSVNGRGARGDGGLCLACNRPTLFVGVAWLATPRPEEDLPWGHHQTESLLEAQEALLAAATA